jgi:hypothetical protein
VRSSLELVWSVVCVVCVCVCVGASPSYIGWRQAVTEGIFPSAPPHHPSLHQCCLHERDGPRRCHRGRGHSLGHARLGRPLGPVFAWPPLLCSWSAVAWWARPGFARSWPVAPPCPSTSSRKRLSDSISLFSALVFAIVIVLLVYLETGQLHMYMCV